MSETRSADDERAEVADADGQGVPQRRRTPRGRAAAGIVLLLVVGLLLTYFLWWTRPSTFTGVGNALVMKQTTDDLHPVTYDMVQRSAHEDPETISLRGVRGRVVTNTADALITFTVCQQKDIPFMAANGTAKESCEEVAEVGGQQLRLEPSVTATIAMTVTPRRVGRVVIRGMQVDYTRGASHWWQRGGQSTGPVIKVIVKR